MNALARAWACSSSLVEQLFQRANGGFEGEEHLGTAAPLRNSMQKPINVVSVLTFLSDRSFQCDKEVSHFALRDGVHITGVGAKECVGQQRHSEGVACTRRGARRRLDAFWP